MAKISIPKEKLEGLPKLPVGIYEVRLDGFTPAKAKKIGSDTINLNPTLKIINHPTLNDRQVFFNMNTGFPPGIIDLVHGFGVTMDTDAAGDAGLPGEFVPPDEPDPSKWTYMGPLTGRTAKVELGEFDNGRGGKNVKIKRFFCAVPGCAERHAESLN